MLELYTSKQKESVKRFSDEELIEAFRSEGKKIYLEIVLDRHYKPLLLFIRKYYARNNLSQAEDIVQEACLKVYLSLSTFDSSRKFKPWLYKIAVNTGLGYLKNPANVNIEQCFGLAVVSDSPEIYVDKKIQQEKLQSAIAKLQPDCKEIVNLFYVEDSNHEEVGIKLGMCSAGVRHKLQQAKRNLLTNFEL